MRCTVPVWFRLAARVRGLATVTGLLVFLAAVLGGIGDWWPGPVVAALGMTGLALVGVGQVLTLAPMRPPIEALPVAPPVRGPWSAVNSPAGRVPSHGTHGHGQTYAIDLVHGPGFRPPDELSGSGEEVRAPAAGRVVAVCAGTRGHQSRAGWAAYAHMIVEDRLREVLCSRFVLGSFVVLDLGGGVHAVLGHLRRGSVVVRRGQRVEAGELVAWCGGSADTGEPHLHFQLMDHRWPFLAAGLPFVFTVMCPDGVVRLAGVPADEEFLMPAR